MQCTHVKMGWMRKLLESTGWPIALKRAGSLELFIYEEKGNI